MSRIEGWARNLALAGALTGAMAGEAQAKKPGAEAKPHIEASEVKKDVAREKALQELLKGVINSREFVEKINHFAVDELKTKDPRFENFSYQELSLQWGSFVAGASLRGVVDRVDFSSFGEYNKIHDKQESIDVQNARDQEAAQSNFDALESQRMDLLNGYIADAFSGQKGDKEMKVVLKIIQKYLDSEENKKIILTSFQKDTEEK